MNNAGFNMEQRPMGQNIPPYAQPDYTHPVYGNYQMSAEMNSVEAEKKKAKKRNQNINKNQDEYMNKKASNGGGKVLKKVVAIALAGVLFGVVAGASFVGVNYWMRSYIPTISTSATESANQTEIEAAQESETTQTPSLVTSNNVTAQPSSINTVSITEGEMTVKEIAANCMSSIVAITNVGVSQVQTFWGTYQTESQSTGSGIIIGETESELLIVTNYHVVSGSNELTVVFSYDEASVNPNAVSAKIKGYDSQRDLAVIAVEMSALSSDVLNQISMAVIGDSSQLELGDQVVAIGNALGYGQSVTVGYISALNRNLSVEGENGGTTSNSYIQTDAAINPGNSGGALFNMKGELIGINSVKVASSEVEGMGYAIPITDVEDIISQLMTIETRDVVNAEDRGYLGIKGQSVTSEISSFGIPVGAFVQEVTAGSAAEAAGIQSGDVITAFDGKTINSFETLQEILQYYAAGETITITLMRNAAGGYQEMQVTATLCSAEEAGIATSDITSEGPAQDSNGAYNFGDGNGSSNGNSSDQGGSNGGGYSPEDFYNFFFGF